MNALPPPEFVKIDPLAIEQDLITRYEKRSGKKLYPAQIEHLFIDQVDYALVRALSAIQQTGEQMLVSYSEAPIIDYLGELVGVTRLPAQPAVCTLRWQLDAPQSQDAFIPMFTGVSNDEDTVIFTTDYDVTIAAGTLYADVTATCRDVGKVGNGFNAGQVSKPGRSLPAGVTVANISTTSGGDAEESTEQLRERIKLAPESFSNAGSYGAYQFHVRSVHPSIISVAVLGPDEGLPPGHVELYLQTLEGTPSHELLALVQAKVSSERKRPLTDRVTTKAPITIDWQLRAKLTLYTTADTETTLALAKQAAESNAQQLRSALGRDIVPNQIIKALQVEGVYDVELVQPAKRIPLRQHEWANCTAIELTIARVSDG
ncbi:baseplate assembly protein [Yersinia pseudotuberculosis]|uniref:baseplate assembly protein n=1 Tax=Yersinia pseudotuberculosis TaxID=633 RepID=UPI000E062E8B|nr:baseplate J/gp47 family protein [Yersinia pseudotuberculosis]SUQ18050.1 baseplate assembly protein [Yersinia pseudotuberculosis]